MSSRHTVCLTAHPDDAAARDRFAEHFSNTFYSVCNDPAEAEVHIVLVGQDTWRSAYVDQRIAAGLDRITDDERGGALMGVLLDGLEDPPPLSKRSALGAGTLHPTAPRHGRYWCRQIPRRLHINIEGKRAHMRPWSVDHEAMSGWIHDAYMARKKHPASNELGQMEVDYAPSSLCWMAAEGEVGFEVKLTI